LRCEAALCCCEIVCSGSGNEWSCCYGLCAGASARMSSSPS
jgi:hypothetical protein